MKKDKQKTSDLAIEASRLVRHLTDALTRISQCVDAPDLEVSGDYEFGLHCGVEDNDCSDRYEGANYGYTTGMEAGLEWATNEAKHALETVPNK